MPVPGVPDTTDDPTNGADVVDATGEPNGTAGREAVAPEVVECKYCGERLENPLGWTTLGEGEANDSLYFCDDDRLERWTEVRGGML